MSPVECTYGNYLHMYHVVPGTVTTVPLLLLAMVGLDTEESLLRR